MTKPSSSPQTPNTSKPSTSTTSSPSNSTPDPITYHALPSMVYTTPSDLLDKGKNNWPQWKQTILDNLEMCALGDYLTGSIPCPDRAADRTSYANWLLNDKAVKAYLRSKCGKKERDFLDLEECPTTATVWAVLRLCHKTHGPFTQVLIMCDLIGCHFDPSQRLAPVTNHIRDLVTCFLTFGPVDFDILFTIFLVHAMFNGLDTLQKQVNTLLSMSSTGHPFRSPQIVDVLEHEQQVLDSHSTFSTTSDTLVAKVGKPSSFSKKVCSNCKNTGHARLTKLSFTRLSCEYCIYFRETAAGTVISGIHVDDFILVASTPQAAAEFKSELRAEWQISDLGEARFCVGIAIERDRPSRTVAVSQTALIDKIISQFNLTNAYPVSAPMDPGLKLSRADSPTTDAEKSAAAKLPYRALVGSLNYVAVGSRPDISFAIQQLSQFLDCYGETHWEAAKCVVRYLKGTCDFKLHLGGSRVANLLGFTDSNHAACVDTQHSIGGYCFSLSSGVVTWASRKQATVSTSSCEAEYVAASEASKEAVWLRALLDAVSLGQPHASTLLCDNNGAICLSSDPSFHARVKHIHTKYHYIRELVESEQLSVSYVNTHDNVADIFTKPLGPKPFTCLCSFLGLHAPPP